MHFNELFFCAGLLLALLFYIWRIGINLSVTSVMLGLLCVLHGPFYLYYTRVWGPQTDFFEHILLAAPNEDVIGNLDIALGLLFIFICFGITCADFIFGRYSLPVKSAITIWKNSSVRVTPKITYRVQLLALTLIPVVLIPFMIIEGQVQNTFVYFTSSLDEFGKIAMRRELGGEGFYLYNLLQASFLPFISYCLLSLVLAGHKRFLWLAVAFIFFIVIAKAATLSKAPLAVFILQLLIVGLMCKRLQLSLWPLFKLIVMAAIFFLLMAFVANPDLASIQTAFEFLFYRIFMIPNEGLMEYFSAIPYVLPHSWGAQFSWVATLFQQEPKEATYWLVGEVHRGVMGSTTTVMFLGDAWADFAWFGVCIISFLVGLLIRWIDIELIVKRGKSVESIAGLAAAHYGVFIALNTAFQTALLTGGLLLILPFVFLVSGRATNKK